MKRILPSSQISCGFVAAVLLFAAAPAAFAVPNTATIRERAGVTTANYPVQMGRPFVQGEIRDYPEVLLNGTPALTQADVKQRWPDGSVRHAILSFLIPSLAANSTVTLTFRNQPSGNTGGGLTRDQMLGANFNFDATMALTNGVIKTASARTMVAAGHYTTWLSGAVSTSVIIADHSTSRAYDLGFDSYRPFRPVFHATFWPAINRVWVRYIGEVANPQEMEDVVYSLELRAGHASPAAVFSQASFTHYAAARWTKEAWIGGAPAAIDLNHNVAYLSATTLLANYDSTKVVPESAIASRYTAWSNASKMLMTGTGNLQKAMGTAGGRPEIGMYPSWTVQWLYTGDRRLREAAFGNADIGATWPVHYRESVVGKHFLRGATDGDALGRPVSITARPTLFANLSYIKNYTSGWNAPADRIVYVGTDTNGGWVPDGAHQPDLHSPQYLLTGDFWHLEEMWFWASWTAAKFNPGSVHYGRGPTGAHGGMPDELRGQAWCLRNRAHAAAYSPDGTPEQQYFSQLMEDVVAFHEGFRRLPSPRSGTEMYSWASAHHTVKYPKGLPPLRHFDAGNAAFLQSGIDTAITSAAHSVFEHNFMMLCLGRVKELGYGTDILVSWAAPYFIGIMSNPASTPYLMAAYRTPTMAVATNTFFTSWESWVTGYQATYLADASSLWSLTDTEHGYAFIGMAAAAQVAQEPSGSAAWSWMAVNALRAPALSDNPKWAIVPRTSSSGPGAPTGIRVLP